MSSLFVGLFHKLWPELHTLGGFVRVGWVSVLVSVVSVVAGGH